MRLVALGGGGGALLLSQLRRPDAGAACVTIAALEQAMRIDSLELD